MKIKFPGRAQVLSKAIGGILYLYSRGGNKGNKSSKTILLTLAFLGINLLVHAQPLPPTTPSGSPVPVEGLFGLLPLALMALGAFKLRKEK